MGGVFEDIRQVVAKIPAGSVATYGQVAAMVGRPRAARMVAWALHRSSDPSLPCHRVVSRTGHLAPEHVFGGLEIQRRLLVNEGVRFRDDGSIDMTRHLWEP